MGIKKALLISGLLVIQLAFAIGLDCFASTNNDLNAIKNLFLTFERGYEERNIEKYMSVFSEEEYNYVSDMTTPDDPSDDIVFTQAESERRSAIKVFSNFEHLDMELLDLKITINNNSAEVNAQIRIVFIVFEGLNFPDVYYAVSNNIFNLRKFNSQWKLVKWQQNELSAEDLTLWSHEESKNKGIDDLIKELGDARMVKWSIALSDLRKIRDIATPSIIKALRSPNRNLRTHAIWVFAGTQNGDAIKEIISILKNEKEYPEVRIAAINALSRCDANMIDNELFKAASNGNPKIKAAALLALAQRIKQKSDELYQATIEGTFHSDETLRKSAVESMGIMMTAQGCEPLEKRFGYKNESEEVRLAAMESLKKMRSDSAPNLFRDAVKDKNESLKIRASATRILGEIKDEESLNLLINIAKDKNEPVELRKAAITSLGDIGNPKSTKTLISLLNSPDATLRYEAVKSLEILGDRRALKPLMMVMMNREEKDWIRRLAGRGAVKIDKDIAFGPLVQILKDVTENAPARRMAAEELTSSGNPRSIAVFANVLKDKQNPWWLRRIAVTCLAQLESFNSPIYAEALKIAVSDPDERVANAAREVLNIKPGLLSRNQ